MEMISGPWVLQAEAYSREFPPDVRWTVLTAQSWLRQYCCNVGAMLVPKKFFLSRNLGAKSFAEKCPYLTPCETTLFYLQTKLNIYNTKPRNVHVIHTQFFRKLGNLLRKS